MTTSADRQARRRLLVRLSVLTASALTFAASWLGVALADSRPLSVAVSPSQLAAPRDGPASGLVPAPAATRQVVIVRRSRAS